jgi:hypothetical protein
MRRWERCRKASADGAKGKSSLCLHAATLLLGEFELYRIQQNWPKKPRSQLLMTLERMSKHSIIKFAKSASQETGVSDCSWRSA